MNSIILSLLGGFAMTTSIFAETSSCPNQLALLRSAFEVAIDLHAPTEDNVSCSQQDTRILEDLVEDSMNEATRKIAEWKPSDQFKDGDSKVCNDSQQQQQQQQQSRRRINQQGQNHGMFRYYGGMRCRLCSKDDGDAAVKPASGGKMKILKFDETSQSMKCHRYSSFDDLTQEMIHKRKNTQKEKSLYTINVHAPSLAQEFKIQVLLGLGNRPSWNGQHIYIIINSQTFDLGPFQNWPVVERQSPGFNVTNEIGWSIKPGLIDSLMYLVEMTIPRSFYSKKSMLKVKILFGKKTASPRHRGRVSSFETFFGTILPASECEDVPNNPSNPHWNRKLKQQKTMDSVSSPTSPVLSPVSSPQSSPVGAPVKHNKESKRATAKKEKNNQAKSLTSKMVLPKEHILGLRKKTPGTKSNVNASKQRTKKKKTTTRRMDRVSVPAHSGPIKRVVSRNNPKRKSSSSTRQKTRDSSISKTKKKSRKTTPKQRMTARKKKTEQSTDKGVVDADDSASSYDMGFFSLGKEASVSTSSHFQNQVKSTLSTVLEDKIENTLRPGHCMYAKSITAEVDLVPKPDWEERLPACDGEQS